MSCDDNITSSELPLTLGDSVKPGTIVEITFLADFLLKKAERLSDMGNMCKI